ncbi:MAG: leucyl/phenylalanyl-tRNA--protein transferase [Proteobacteria bacterium]|nr:leucyl/phenylalanyl-tRNA--protein transferase [Pseudomonadota bacterium]
MPVYLLSNSLNFPPPYLAERDGLLAIGGDLSVERLLLAYSMGIFPWYSKRTPILWWSPDPRFVIFIDKFHIPKRLARLYKSGKFKYTINKCFKRVVELCAEVHEKNDGSTWITEEMISAYYNLHKKGYAHSIETWENDNLVGGLYGVSIGAIFSGESMFSLVSNASKLALVFLWEHLKNRGFKLIDCQVKSEHLKQFGAESLSRNKFLSLLKIYSNLQTNF